MMGMPARNPLAESHPLLHYIAPTRPVGGARAFAAEEKAILDQVNQKIAGEASLDDLLQFLFEPVRELYPATASAWPSWRTTAGASSPGTAWPSTSRCSCAAATPRT